MGFNFFPKVMAATISIGLPPSIPDWNINNLIKKVVDVVSVLVIIGIFLAILRSAYLMVSSQGDVAQFEKGKKGLIWSVTGLAVILLARFSTGVVLNFITANPSP